MQNITITTSIVVKLAAVLIALAALTTLSGCESLAEITAFRDRAAAARDDASAEIDALESAAADLPPGDPRAAELGTTLDALATRREALDDMVERLDVLLAEAESPTDTLSGVAHELSPFLPEPFRLPILLAAGLGVSLFRAGQLKRSAASIAAGFQEAMQRDTAIREGLVRHKDLLNAVQTPTAKRIVDEVTKTDRSMLRLPL